MHAADKIFVRTYLAAFRDSFFSRYVEFPNISYFYPTEGKSLNFQACRKTASPPPQFLRLVGHPDLAMRKTLKQVGLLTVLIFLQSKKFTATNIKDEKEETIFYLLMLFNLLKIIQRFESKKRFKDLVKLNCKTQEYLVCY